MKHLDLTDPVHVALLIIVAMMSAAILVVGLTDVDSDPITLGLIALTLSACLVVASSRGRTKDGSPQK